MCKEIETRNDFYHPGPFILAKSGSADVEMGILSFEMPDMGLLPAGPAVEPLAPAPESNHDLDAVAKGKGKSQVDSDQCSRCFGRGHYARDCQTARDSADQTKCNGCGGKGHMIKDCPTWNPALRGAGKGWGGDPWGKGGGGKNKGYGQAWNKGG